MAPPQPTTTKPDVEDDPIVATYNVFIKPPLPQDRKLVVLRYVTKTAQDPSSIKPPRINGFRVKPETGIYEVDIPLETSDGYNKDKGIAWGVALAKSMESKKGGSLGLAGGFNIGGQGGSARGGPGAGGGAGGRRGGNSGGGDDDEAQNLSWPEAVAQGKAVIDQKLTGSRSAGEDYVKHMVGVFQGNNLHLTPVTSLVQLRPVAPYLDAATEQERLARLGPSAAGGAGGPADKQAAGRAIHMSIKSSDSGAAGAAAETMADRLRAVQTEPWHNLKWYHDEHGEAWDTYNECMLLRSSEAANAAPVAEEEVDEEKKKEMKEEKDGEEAAAAEPTDDSGAPDLVEKVNRLQSDWGEEQILRSINGLGPDDKKPGEEAVSVPSVFGTKKATVTAAANKVVDSKGKGKVVAAATSSSSNAMQLD